MRTVYERHRKCFLYLAAFFLPVLFAGAGFMIRGIDPFGPNCLAAIDGYGQYFPMLREAERHFFNSRSYSFSGALGFSFAAESAYYTNSPLNILLFILPGPVQPFEMDLIILLRFGLMSLSMFHLLSKHYRRLSLLNLSLSSAYALSSYTLAFINQIMWMDALILLPFLCLQIGEFRALCCPYDRKRMKKTCILYTAALVLLICSCFYTAYMVCLFLCLFFLYTLLREPGAKKVLLRSLLFFLAFSLLSGFLSLPVLLPLLKALRQTVTVHAGRPDFSGFLHPQKDFFLRLLPFMKPSLAYGAPNLYFGLFALVPLLLALTDPALSLRKKLSASSFLLLLLVSLNLPLTNYIWHGFHLPAQLPGRESFLFIFLVLFFAGSGWQKIPRLWKRALLPLLLTAEILANTLFGFSYVKCVSSARVTGMDEKIDRVRDTITPDLSRGEFWRTELSTFRDNGGQLYGYFGISYYSSTMSGSAYRFFTSLGADIYARNVSVRFSEPEKHPLLLDLFSVRYLVTDDGTLTENEDALPLLFACSSAVMSEGDAPWKASGNGSCALTEESVPGIVTQDAFFQALSGVRETILTSEGELDDKAYRRCREAIDSYGDVSIGSIRETLLFTEIDAEAEIRKEGVLLLGLPHADVSSVQIDGRDTACYPVCGFLTAVPVSCGTHRVRIRLTG